MEIFKFVIGSDEGYKVSDFGNVISLKRNKSRLMKLTDNGAGYLVVNLTIKGKQKSRMVHQLVAECFLDHKPNGHTVVVDHIDNCKTNNKAVNLQLVSVRINSTKDRKGCASRYTGVSKQKDKWHSRIYLNGKSVHLGFYTNEIDASNAYKKALKDFLS